MTRLFASLIAAIALASAAHAQSPSSTAVHYLQPPGAITPTGPWGLASKAGNTLYVAGMRGIDPKSNALVQGDEARVRQAFMNMKQIVEASGGTLQQTLRLVVYVSDMYRYRPLANKVQEELWGKGPYPPRTIVEVDRLNQDDIIEVEGTFYVPN